MKDLFVFTADADAEGLIRSVLNRSRGLGIRPITFDVERHVGRDPGMVKDGPEIARMKVQKADYKQLILVWDHDGSGWHTMKPDNAVAKIQQRLNGITWESRSAAIVIVPELEEWIWHCRTSLARHFELTPGGFDRVIEAIASDRDLSIERFSTEFPKEFLGDLFYKQRRCQPLPEDFANLAASANLQAWASSPTFRRFRTILREWFPPNKG